MNAPPRVSAGPPSTSEPNLCTKSRSETRSWFWSRAAPATRTEIARSAFAAAWAGSTPAAVAAAAFSADNPVAACTQSL
eukprot:6184167-Pyramimonas_sp.AAC.1